MRKSILILFFLTACIVQAQDALVIDDMEWSAGACPSHWSLWTGGAGCPPVGQGQAQGGAQSGYIPGDNTTDILLNFGNKIFGDWETSFWMYVPSNKEAYMNLQGEVPVNSGQWIVGNIFFNQDLVSPGLGIIDNTALGVVNFNFPHDQWFKIYMRFDITAGISAATWEMTVDGDVVIPVGTPFTDSAGTTATSLGGINFFSISTDTEFYIDSFGSSLDSSAAVDDPEICTGNSTTLRTNPTGGTENYTFSWSSVPAGFSSIEQDPSISPVVTTTYTVMVNDGVETVSSSVTVDVFNASPGQATLPIGDDNVCQNSPDSVYSTTPVVGASTYEWTINPSTAGFITGSSTSANVNWNNTYTGNAAISVIPINACGSGTTSNPLNITIHELPVVLLGSFDGTCVTSPSFALTGGTPIGGSYSGTGVSGGNFNPAFAGPGFHTITYTYEDAQGCENSAARPIEVFPLPNVNLAPFDEVMVSSPPFVLSGGTPSGGNYSGTGVSGNMFDPSAAGIGIHTITYTYIDGNSCENFSTEAIEVITDLGIPTENLIEFVLYPNPGQEYITLSNPQSLALQQVAIYDLTGRLIQTIDLNNMGTEKTIDVTMLPTATYMVVIQTEKDQIIKRLLKE